MADELPSYESGGPPPPALAPTTSPSPALARVSSGPGSPTLAPPNSFPTAHSFPHTLGGKDSCNVTIKSRALQTAHRPHYYPGDTVEGTLEFEIAKKITLKGIDVKLRGFTQQTAFAGMQEHQLQTAGMKETFVSAAGKLSDTAIGKTLDKGKHSISFSFVIPKTFMWQGEREFDIPPSYVLKGLPQSYQYDLEVQVKKKGLFSTDEQWLHPLRITPFAASEPYGPLREAAYAENATELLGPADDPDGWELTSSTVKGRLFDAEDVEAYMRMFLATPLNYPLTGFIPFILTFESANKQALDHLSSTSSFMVTLTSHVIFGTDVSIAAGKATNESRRAEAKAQLWPEADASAHEKGAERFSKTWNGELRVPRDLNVQFVSPIITLKYLVEVTINAPGFNPHNANPDSVYLKEVVKLASLPPSGGPRARSMFPAPSYSSAGGSGAGVGSANA